MLWHVLASILLRNNTVYKLNLKFTTNVRFPIFILYSFNLNCTNPFVLFYKVVKTLDTKMTITIRHLTTRNLLKNEKDVVHETCLYKFFSALLHGHSFFF